MNGQIPNKDLGNGVVVISKLWIHINDGDLFPFLSAYRNWLSDCALWSRRY
jgi:hypothetical protein